MVVATAATAAYVAVATTSAVGKGNFISITGNCTLGCCTAADSSSDCSFLTPGGACILLGGITIGGNTGISAVGGSRGMLGISKAFGSLPRPKLMDGISTIFYSSAVRVEGN